MTILQINEIELIKKFKICEEKSITTLDSPMKRQLVIASKSVIEEMLIGLVILGMEKFAPYLKTSLTKGYCATANMFLAELTNLIGLKLANGSINISVDRGTTEELANKCVELIKENVSHYSNQELTKEQALRIVANFDIQVIKFATNLGHREVSYISSIGITVPAEVTQQLLNAALPPDAGPSSSQHTVQVTQTSVEILKGAIRLIENRVKEDSDSHTSPPSCHNLYTPLLPKNDGTSPEDNGTSLTAESTKDSDYSSCCCVLM